MAQHYEDNATGQIQNVLDNSTNRILLGDVIGNYGEEGKRILVQIAGDSAQPPGRRGQAIQMLGEYRSPAGEELLKQMLDDSKTICGAIPWLGYYRSPELVPRFIDLLDDHRSCGNLVQTIITIGVSYQEKKTEVYVSDEAVGALERITGNHFEKESDLFVIGHRSTEVWKKWWSENRTAFMANPSQFLTSESAVRPDDSHYPCSVATIAVSPDGKLAFSAGMSYDPWVRAWNIESRQQLWATPNIRDDDAQSSAFSPDGRIIAMSTSHGAVKVFDAITGHRIRMLISSREVEAVVFNHSGTMLAFAQDDGVIRLFDTSNWREIKQLDNADMTEGIAFSPDDAMMAAATFEQVRLWDISSGIAVRTFKVRPAVSPSLFIDESEYRAQLWRMAWRVAFSPDGKTLATGSSASIQLWNPATGQEISNTPSNGQVGSLHFSPDGHWVVWGNDQDKIFMWNPNTRKRQRIKNEPSLGDTAMTPDGKLILSPGVGQEIGIYDLAARRKVGVLQCKKQN
jgi:WD40 repeat protein